MEYKAHKQSGLLLNANECSRNLAPAILDSFQKRLQHACLNRYPDDEARELIEAYADLYHLDPAGVLIGNGSDALLQLMITAFCREGKTLATLNPDFGMYHFYAHAKDTDVCEFETRWDGSFDLEKLAAFTKESNAGLLLFSNPNNPTGHMVSREDLVKLAQSIAPAVLAVDEAYMDFADESVLDLAQSMDNLIVTRTLSKAWGAAGIRLGFLIASPALVQILKDWKIVYSVSTLDQLAALAVLDHPEIMREYVSLVQSEREKLAQVLDRSGFLCGPFNANFYAVSLHDGRQPDPEDNLELSECFEQAGITVRTFPEMERIRITIGTPEENRAALQILGEWTGKDLPALYDALAKKSAAFDALVKTIPHIETPMQFAGIKGAAAGMEFLKEDFESEPDEFFDFSEPEDAFGCETPDPEEPEFAQPDQLLPYAKAIPLFDDEQEAEPAVRIKSRQAKASRDTKETQIEIALDLDGTGQADILTPIGFFNHMLELFAFHSQMDLRLHADGDTDVDDHHLVEDAGILLGQLVKEALGDKRGIRRYGSCRLPMDESLAVVDLDFSGRPYLVFNGAFHRDAIKDYATEMTEEFLRAFAFNAGLTLHVTFTGKNDHHQTEAIFKGLARAVKEAVFVESDRLNSSKGVLE